VQNARGVEESAAGIQEHRPTMDAHENIEMISFARHPERGRCSPTRVAATGALARHGRELRDDDEILTPARQHPGRHRDVHKRTGETREDLTAQGQQTARLLEEDRQSMLRAMGCRTPRSARGCHQPAQARASADGNGAGSQT